MAQPPAPIPAQAQPTISPKMWVHVELQSPTQMSSTLMSTDDESPPQVAATQMSTQMSTPQMSTQMSTPQMQQDPATGPTQQLSQGSLQVSGQQPFQPPVPPQTALPLSAQSSPYRIAPQVVLAEEASARQPQPVTLARADEQHPAAPRSSTRPIENRSLFIIIIVILAILLVLKIIGFIVVIGWSKHVFESIAKESMLGNADNARALADNELKHPVYSLSFDML